MLIYQKAREDKLHQQAIKGAKAFAIDIRIEDKLPISDESDIDMKILELSGGEYDKGKWDIKLNPKEEQVLIVKYAVNKSN